MINTHQQLLSKIKQDVLSRWAITLIETILICLLWWFNLVGNITKPVIILLSSVTILNSLIYFIIIKKGKTSSLAEYIIKFVDVVLISYVVYWTGVINSPFYVLYILLILLEGFSLNKRYVIYDFILSAFSYASLVIIMDIHLLTGQVIITPILIWTLTARLTFIFLASWISSIYIKFLLLQKKKLEDSNAENIRLYEKIKQFNKDLEQKIKEATTELKKKAEENSSLYVKYYGLFINMAKAIATAANLRDPYYEKHSIEVTEISLIILDELSLSSVFEISSDLKGTLYLAGILHDIGRMVLKDETLKNPGPLSEAEWEEMKQVPIVGAQIVESIKELEQVAKGIRYHYERFDGKGYPDGLKGKEIPLVSRILAVANDFDAMISDRTFRTKLSNESALRELEKNSGTQFDPAVVDAFIKAYRKGKINKGK